MTEEEIKKLKQTVDYFGHWYDVIGEERVAILEKAVNELEATKELQEENERLAKHILELQADKGRLTDELTEAKEIIRELLPFAKRECVSSAKFNAKEIKKAEAFLKE